MCPKVWTQFSLFLSLHFTRCFFLQLFTAKRGAKRRATKRHITTQMCYESLAYRILIQGRQEAPTEANPNKHFLDDQFRAASGFFTENLEAGISFLNWDFARRINSALCIKVGSDQEHNLVENFR